MLGYVLSLFGQTIKYCNILNFFLRIGMRRLFESEKNWNIS